MATLLTSPEYDAMFKHTGMLVTALDSHHDISTFSSKLLDKGVISTAEQDTIIGIQSSSDKAQKIVSCVTAKIKSIDPGVLQVFLSTLEHEQEPQLKQAAKTLQESLSSFKDHKRIQQDDSISEMRQKFKSHVKDTLKSFASRITPSALRNSFNLLHAYDKSVEPQDLLLKEHLNQVNQASSNEELFQIIEPFMSFFNPGVLHHVVEYLGTDKDRENFKEYMKILDEFSNGFFATGCVLAEIPQSAMEHFQELKVRFNKERRHLKRIQHMKSEMAKIFRLNACTLHLMSLQEDLRVVSFSLPNFVCEKLFPLSCEQSKKLQDLGVLSPIECGTNEYSLAISLETVPTLQLPCLGHKFKLGMYYDCRNDNLLGSLNLFGTKAPPDTAVEEIKQSPVDHDISVAQTDTLEEKGLLLGLTPGLKLSLLTGLVQNVSGSAKYWNDRCSSKRVVRVCLKYESTSCIKQLVMKNLIGMQQHHIFEGATHVVTRVLYGLKVILIFDREIGKEEGYEFVQENMVKILSRINDTEDSSLIDALIADTEEVKYSCKVYSDLPQFNKTSYTLSEAINVFRSLPSVGRKGNTELVSIPQKVWLYPLNKLDNKCKVTVRPVATDLITQFQSMLENLHEVEIKANDALSKHSDILSKFQYLHERLTKFAELIVTYRSETKKSIAQILPQVREEKLDEAELAGIVKGINVSPFSSQHQILSSCLQQVEEEIDRIQVLYEHVKDMKFASPRELQRNLETCDCDYVLCFAFNLGGDEDQTIKKMKSYLHNDKEESFSSTQLWYANIDHMKAVLHRIEQFKKFVKENEKKAVQFVVINNASHKGGEIGSILLYEGTTSKTFEPPSAPGKPTANVTQDSVHLQWTKPQYGSESIQCYSISCISLDNPQELRSPISTNCAEESFSIVGLKPETHYIFTVQPVCCCGVGSESEPSEPIVTEKCCQPGKPAMLSTTHNSVQLKWTRPEHRSNSVSSYTVLYHVVDDPENKWNTRTTNGVEESVTITELRPDTKYVFKVRPELSNGVGTESETSDEIRTKVAICQPGKPTKLTVTHNSVELKWNKPPIDSDKVECYMVHYQLQDKCNTKFKSKPTENEEETITGLLPDSSYVFKVKPLLDGAGVSNFSELSDPIKTTATSPPVNLTVSNITGTSVTLQWTKPEYGSEHVTSYTIFYNVEECEDTMLSVDTTDVTAVVSSLHTKTNYVFKVQPNTEGNVGSISEVCGPIETKMTSAPETLTASNITCNSIELNWTVPESGHDKISGYGIVYKSTQEPNEEQEWDNTGNARNSVVITELDMNTGYQFKVCPQCGEYGDGTESEFSEVIYTRATSPPSKPTATACATNDSIGAEVEWTKPDHGSENIKQYLILYQLATDTNRNGQWEEKKTKSAEPKATLTELRPNSSYVFKIIPLCKNDIKGSESEISDPVMTMATSKPGKPMCRYATHQSITLKWESPKCGLENVDSYIIYYCKITGESDVWNGNEIETDSAKNIYELKGLSWNTKYKFKVQAVCKSDKHAISDISDVIMTKPACRPGKPVPKLVTHKSIKFSCKEPDHYHGDVDYYQVHYHKVNQPDLKLCKDMNAQTMSCELSQLEINTEYVINVIPVMNPHCHSEKFAMESGECTIRTCVTSQPGKPTVSGITYDSITIVWDKPRHCDEVIKTYNVLYRFAHPYSCSNDWRTENTKDDEENIVIKKLTPQSKYIFKVLPNCESGTGRESEESDPIQTDTICKPGKPQAVKVTHDSISLHWDKPQHHSDDIDEYKVTYYNNEDFVNITRKHTDALISSLRHNTTYVFKVEPICKSGKEHIGTEVSTSDRIKTKATSPPLRLNSVPLSHDSIKLSWKKPDINSNMITHYTILGKADQDIKTTDGPQESVVIHNLKINERYQFKVRPECGHNGSGTESEFSDICTKATSPPGKPTVTSAVTHNSIEIEWTKPEYGLENVTHYSVLVYNNLTAKQEKRENCKIQNKNSPVFHYTIQQLSPHTEYIVKIRPECLVGLVGTESEFSERIVTKGTSPPRELKAIRVTHSSITLEWIEPEHGADRVNGYTVFYHPSPVRDQDQKWRQIPCDVQTCLTVDGLSMNTKYVFYVTPECKIGVGMKSDKSLPIMTKATSQPTHLKVSDITNNTAKVMWTKPQVGSDNIKGYKISYHLSTEDTWTDCGIHYGTNEYKIIDQLQPKQFYQFKVTPACVSGDGSESEASEYFQTKPVCKPGKITATKTTHDSIVLEWGKPEDLSESVKSYIVTYSENSSSTNSKPNIKEVTQRSISISGLKSRTEYIIEVNPQCKPGTMTEVQSNNFRTADIPFAEKIRHTECSIIKSEIHPVEVYKLPVKYDMELPTMAKCHVTIGNPNPAMPEKVIMLVGATGEGKTTLINSMVNYIYGVDWEYHFRFKLISDETTQSQAHSQTPKVTAYTLYHVPGSSQLNYTLTIVDTPGFGDTRGIDRDKNITSYIQEFFSVKPPIGIDQIHVVGFVTQAGRARLTPTQRYVFESILSMFGKDIKNNIYLMATFSDNDQDPQVLEALKEANIETFHQFVFNNSALYARPGTSKLGNEYWTMNYRSLYSFFRLLETIAPQSLQLTREVLEKREQLQTHVEGLQEKLFVGLDIMVQLQLEQEFINENEINILSRTDNSFKVRVPKRKKVDIAHNQYVTNCTVCKQTCHFPCTIFDDSKKYKCAAMGGWALFRNKESKCTICPRKCSWKDHVNTPYRYEIYHVTETRTLGDLIARYITDSSTEDDSIVAEQLKSGVSSELEQVTEEVFGLIREIRQCVQELQKIALRPSPLDEVAYIDLMIETEMNPVGRKEGFEYRISALKKLKEKASLLEASVYIDARQFDSPVDEQKKSTFWKFWNS